MRRLLPVLAALALLTGCSTVPTSSAPVQITEASARPAGEVGIEPAEPPAGGTPEEVVRGFIDAAASTVRNHPVARQYLTGEAEDAWSDTSGITLVGPDYATVTTDAGGVVLTGDLLGTVDTRGVFTGSAGEPYTREFTLVEVEGEWRITNPPDGLLMLVPDFERLYDERAAYFLDPTEQRVVPDPRYLLGGEAQPTVLVDRLVEGPSPALAAGVLNALDGVTLTRAVTITGTTVSVDLAGLPDLPAARLAQLCAQLVWTLDQLDGVSSVQVSANGEPLTAEGIPAVQRTDDWVAFDPEAAPADADGHYVDGGRLMTDDGQPAPGPAGEGAYGLTAAAVAADPRTSALTSMVGTSVSEGTATLLAGNYGGDLAPQLTGSRFSTPTVAATRPEFWVVRDETTVVRLPAGGSPQPVNAPTLPAQGRATALQLSPDGVRAAVVVSRGTGGSSLLVGTVVRSDEGPVALRDLRPVAPRLTSVVDVAWPSADRLMVLAGDGEEGAAPYVVGVDGWGLTEVPTSGLPSPPTSVAAAPGQLPLVSAGGWVWQLSGGTWVTLIRGAQPVPGLEPFYPV
ncbi:sporulation and spore germination protein [Geodermatophilus tzadiensis]|uniref:Sporulation and spore germination protein n=1 Tax=Geodermatophilus tzadiensis TaxID=1137988 RepID=A0A2T0U1S0_9ACTN|nr:LpqB family beta-propeller domain-containing protein [Geodermatophilus tzadiensis]PRY51843.1 sporulation and spore germination protein [Geodermatophilus tzadiensis]